MPFAGRSHVAMVVALGVWIAIVFVACARLTGASRRAWLAALAGSAAAAAINLATDAAAHAAGFWRYPEATTPFGPVLYYLEAGLGCGALALVVDWLGRRHGRRAQVWFVVALGVYAPIRDWATARTTGLIAFDYDPWPVVIVADALSSFVIPVVTAYSVIALTRPRPPSRRRASTAP